MNSGGERTPLEVKTGDHALFSKYGGSEFTLGEHKYLLMREDEILAINA